jgi:cell division protein FtsN
MLNNKTVLAICCALLIAIAGCSRQQGEWQKAREANTTDAYEQFLKKYPSGEFSAQAQARLKEKYEERDWQKARDADTLEAYQAFLQQYPEGKDTEEARVRVENFTLAQTPAGSTSTPGAAGPNGTSANEEAPGVSPPSSEAGSAAAGASSPSRAEESAGSLHRRAERPAASAPGGAERPPASARSESRSESGSRSEMGKYAVQLGAFKSGHSAANQRWEHLRKEYPKLFAGVSSKVVPRKSGGATLYRLQAVGMSESHARRICSTLKAKSQPCVLIRPQHVT